MKEVGYARGTSYASGGLHWTQEDGKEEIIIRVSDGAILTPLKVGDKVVNTEGTSNLYDFANNPQEFLAKMGLNYAVPSVNVKVPDVSALKRNNTAPSVNLGGVNIDIGQVVANNPEEFTSQLKQNLANNRTVQKIVQEVGVGGSLGHNSMKVKTYL